MKVILNQDVIGLGEEGDIREVASGYARNYLLPKSLAVPHTKANLASLERRRGAIEARRTAKRTEALGLKERLEAEELKFAMPAGENGKLFGSVSSHTISELLKEKGYDINHRKVILEEPIRELGVYEVGVELAAGVEAMIKVWVVKE